MKVLSITYKVSAYFFTFPHKENIYSEKQSFETNTLDKGKGLHKLDYFSE